jgi:MinD superfamily P-loop ATPase
MILAIASAKGGTGKTTVAANLAMCFRGSVDLVDCDVEAPNCHIFISPEIEKRERVCLPVPVVDESRCSGCGECSRMCQYSAIVVLKSRPLVFPSLCHGCGGCVQVCPMQAISEGRREIGTIEIGTGRNIRFVRGLLDVGPSMSPPLIRAVKRHISGNGVSILDCPPGISCPVIAAVKGSDYVVLVTEPSPFGLHDLKLSVETMRQLSLRFGVVINRAVSSESPVADYCRRAQIPVLMAIPDDRRAAEAYSRGQLLVESVPELREYFEHLAARLVSEMSRRKAGKRPGQAASAGIA